MANTIKLKRGSGSDPSASDLAVGEVAVRTDEGKLFTKKDDGSVAEISGGGIDDGDKGDITVSNTGATFTIDNDAVTFAKMQNVNTSRILGRISSSSGNIEQLTAANVRTLINVENGATADQTAAEIRALVESASDSNVFTDADHSKLNGIASGATNVTNTNQLTNGAGFITATLTNEQVQDIVGGMVSGNTESGITVTYQDGDGTLDFSVASQTDNNFTNADHSKLDGIESGATADQTASEILTLLKTVDGSGSGLDADTLDGISSASFLRSDANDTTTGNITLGSSTNEKLVLSGSSNPYIRWQEGTTDKAYIQWNANGYLDLVNQETNDGLRIQSGSSGLKYRIDGTSYNVWHQANDGSGSGLDADSVDGVHASAILRSDIADTASGDITFSGGAGAVTIAANSDIRLESGTWSGDQAGKIQHHQNIFYIQGGTSGIQLRGSDGGSMALFQNTSTILYDDVNFQGGAGAATIAANSDIRFTNGNWTGNSCKIQHHGNSLYIQGGSNSSYNIILRSNSGSDRLYMNAAGDLYPATAGATDLGLSSARFQVGYFDELDSAEVRVNNGILETKAAIATSHTLTADYNALAVSPTINSGVTVTVPSGAVFAIV